MNNAMNPTAQVYQMLLQQAMNNNPNMSAVNNGPGLTVINDERIVYQTTVNPGQTMFFYHPTAQKMWIKSTDINNIPCALRIFELREITNEVNKLPETIITEQKDTVTRDEFNELLETMKGLKASVEEWTK